jgi:hypothetical protein
MVPRIRQSRGPMVVVPGMWRGSLWLAPCQRERGRPPPCQLEVGYRRRKAGLFVLGQQKFGASTLHRVLGRRRGPSGIANESLNECKPARPLLGVPNRFSPKYLSINFVFGTLVSTNQIAQIHSLSFRNYFERPLLGVPNRFSPKYFSINFVCETLVFDDHFLASCSDSLANILLSTLCLLVFDDHSLASRTDSLPNFFQSTLCLKRWFSTTTPLPWASTKVLSCYCKRERGAVIDLKHLP